MAATERSFSGHVSGDFRSSILPGKEEEWRRFVQVVVEERLREYEGLRQRLGIRNESVWLARTKGGEAAMVYLETEEPERIVPTLVASEEPFDLWFKERLIECHGRDPAPRRAAAELIAYQDVAHDGHRPKDSGQLL